VVMTTFFWCRAIPQRLAIFEVSEEQLIAAAKTGRRAPFGELCERHMKQVSCVTAGSCETRRRGRRAARLSSECLRPCQGFR